MSDKPLHEPVFNFIPASREKELVPTSPPTTLNAPSLPSSGTGEPPEGINVSPITLQEEELQDAFLSTFDGDLPAEILSAPVPAPHDLSSALWQVPDSREYPYRAIAYLRIKCADGTLYRGTGAFIGTKTLLTAGHNVYFHRHGGWPERIDVMPGRHGNYCPFNYHSTNQFASVTGWVSHQNPRADYGVVFLNAPVGATVGNFAVDTVTDAELVNVRLSGYPSNHGTVQIVGEGNVTSKSHEQVFYNIAAAEGHSGSPVWRNATPTINAIHAYWGPQGRWGVRVNEEVKSQVHEWAWQGG